MKRFTLGLLTTVISLSISSTSLAQATDVKTMSTPDDPYSSLGWRWPTTSNEITGHYRDEEPGGTKHKGIDIGVKLEPVYSVADGKVLDVGVYTKLPIKYVTIRHDDKDPNGNRLIARYLHLDKYIVKKHEVVSRGERIGTSGNTGAPGEDKGRGYHLHFDINNEGKENPKFSDTIDPAYFWPKIFENSALMSNESDHCDHSDHSPIHDNFDDPEYFIEQILIDYIGEDDFYEWLNSNQPENRTLSNLKKHFDITDEDIEEIDREAEADDN
ncbi:M23 family metallopeptidase [Brevibacillus porteri]|nr:M23 family metallopeptidase [Brevibacillus porteri]MED1800560.1 M23 family metallopeptidase [Brevibacillus porteri]MED2134812.1 M23 family metallopeptidase [Brevibacillus porteri]MED2745531.1 M23 family metallopeptidase [Brevibacillus porteri]MED2815628.1 M23 family metallopeptidase [Brevibacillus porteri]MED2896405.1 M23 family metallopeptidase [Brevibacillus porteri]